MDKLVNKNVLVVGLGVSGVAACDLLLNRSARVTALDAVDNAALRATADQLRARGASVTLGATSAPAGVFEFAVISPGIAANTPLLPRPAGGALPVIGELELGFQYSSCLHIAITGTNGKTTTTELIERMLTQNQRRTVAAGNIGTPLCAVVDQTRDLDFVTLEVSSFQLETIQYFRPSVAVLLNITPDHLDRYAGMDEYLRAKARVFENQQAFDWAIVQAEALAQLRALGIEPRSKVITISASDTKADLYFDRGLLVSQLPGWEGPLLDMATCKLAGRHNAENLLAALGVARALRLPLEPTVAALREFAPAPHRCERVGEINGVLYVNDSKATNPDAVAKAIDAMPSGEGGKPNVWLIAGGKDKGFEYHSLGPVLSRRVKGAFLLGETREKLRAAWGLFTPCTLVDSLLEAVTNSAAKSVAGDVVLLSPACSSFDMFRNYQHRGDVFRDAVNGLAKTARSGAPGAPTINGGQPPATSGGEGSR